MNRRAQAEMIEWLPRLIVLLVAVLVIALVVRYYTQRDIDASRTDFAAYLSRLERDPAVYAWTDPSTGRTAPGMIDATKLTPGRLDGALTSTGTIASRVNISGSCIQPFGDYHDQALFERTFPLAAIGIAGVGSATLERRALPVVIVHGAQRCVGTMTILAVRPNTPSKVPL